ncbi:LysR family transcriptional regulator [Pararhizobium sp.]|uniref:LysR family transcriptional regulator n=1 Tax=Pararhizobium sp. TaxID=1977563 RepID=UPI003D13B86B
MESLLNESAGMLAFVRTVETGTFSAAARTLGVTPSAASKSVSRLESVLRAKLLRRSTRRLAMTAEGEAFYARVMPLLREIDASADAVQSYRETSGHLKVSLPGELGRVMLGPILNDFMPRYPGISLEIGMTDRHVDLVRENYDAVFRVGSSDRNELMCRTLAHLEMVLVASPAFLDGNPFPASVEQLAQLKFAKYSLGGQTYPVRFANGREFSPSGRIEFDSATAIREAARSGAGVAHLLKRVVEEDIREGSLVELLPDIGLQTIPFQALHASGSMPSHRLELFTEFIAKVMVGDNR